MKKYGKVFNFQLTRLSIIVDKYPKSFIFDVNMNDAELTIYISNYEIIFSLLKQKDFNW